MTLGLLDLGIVTDRLLTLLDVTTQRSRLWGPPTGVPPVVPGPPFSIEFTGLRPDDPKIKVADCQISLYLFHVTPDKFNCNTFPLGGRARAIPEQPLALTLYYLLSVHAEGRFDRAQQAMSIALKCFHDNAIVISSANPEQFTLTIEPETVDEIGRLWQSLACPLRMSAVYRASVIFLEPEPVAGPSTGLVLRPNVTAVTIDGGPHAVVSSATVTSTGLATIIGAGFVAGSIEVQIGGLVFQPTTTASPEPGRFRVVSQTELRLQFPTGTPTTLTGKYLLRVRLGREQPTAEVWLEVP
jgi:hypothetical protein